MSLKEVLLLNWQRKTISLICALFLWIVVNNSITTTKSFPNVPIKIINIPEGKTIESLLPTGYLSSGIPLTLRGNNSALKNLDFGELEIVLDASVQDHEWLVEIRKKNLHSLNPDVDISRSVTKIIHSQFILKLRKLTTAKIPIKINFPKGEAPEGYQFLDIWPQELYHELSGSEEWIRDLQIKGLHLNIQLDSISKEDLNNLKSALPGNDEIFFFLPAKWKQVTLPAPRNERIDINDPNAYNLHIVFLRKEYTPIKRKIPISVFFPYGDSTTINPDTYTLTESELITVESGISVLNENLYMRNVSRQFLDLVRDNLLITIIAAPRSKKEFLDWSIQLISPSELEDAYVELLLPESSEIAKYNQELHEKRLRERFRDYTRHLTLFTKSQKELQLKIKLLTNTISVDKSAEVN